MNHVDFAALESALAEPTNFERFAEKCERLCAGHLHRDHLGNPSFDGNMEQDGYSMDWLHDQFRLGVTPHGVLTMMQQNVG